MRLRSEEAGAAGATEAADTMPYIETPRCSTCNECTQINNRMFAYNEDNQAYIADPRAGTFRELVEAAESCQVSIIHPGQRLAFPLRDHVRVNIVTAGKFRHGALTTDR